MQPMDDHNHLDTITQDISNDVKLIHEEAFEKASLSIVALPPVKKIQNHHVKVEKLTEAKNVAPVHDSPFCYQKFTNLLSSSHILFATDEWFARAENLVLDSDPIFVPDLYCDEGKVMDGWETRRRREEGHDWCVIAAPHKGDVYGIEIDTAFFTGNQTPRVSIEVANCYNTDMDEEEWKYTWMPGAVVRMAQRGGIQGTGMTVDQVERAAAACNNFNWTEILSMTKLRPGYEETRMHYFTIPEEIRKDSTGFTHVRVNYYPDGGIARMRLWGHPVDEVEFINKTQQELSIPVSAKSYLHPELSCEMNGGIGLECSNKHYGVPSNLIRQGYGKDMGDGWETARHPERPPTLIKDPKSNLIDSPLTDWAVLKLGMGGSDESGISRIIIDTKHFKGNFPESVKIEACEAAGFSDDVVCAAIPEKSAGPVIWFTILHRSSMGPDREHVFDRDSFAMVNSDRKVTHVRISIYPDGGLSRVRVFGQPAKE